MDLIPFSLTGHCLESYFIKITTRSRIIYWIIISIIITGIVILPFIYVDVSVQARGYFQSDIEKQVVYTPFQGKVIYISIRNGVKVNKGDTLLVIDAGGMKAQKDALLQRLAENDLSISDLTRLTGMIAMDSYKEDAGLVTQRYQAEYSNLRNQYSIQEQKYQKKKSEHDRNELLYGQELIPDIEYENSLYELSSEEENLQQILLYQRSLWQGDLALRRIESVKLLADLEQYSEGLSNRIVVAPISGEIIQSSDIQTGSIVNQGQKIAEISPDGELVATCFVEPADIGLIHENQQVKIQVDAFNYNEWGMLGGDITDISDDMIIENGSLAYFRIKCKPDKTYLSLKNGHKAYIKKGMSINTRIVVIRRSLFNLLFDKADKWFNPYTSTSE
jgi:membrane fusion protein, peptide pheromone/bacteriocin exporter